MPVSYYNRSNPVNGLTNYVVAVNSDFRHSRRVLDTDQLLAMLAERGIKNVEIAKALGLPDSRVPEIKQKKRRLSLDEGVTLARTFGLEAARPVPPLPPAISRLIVRYIAQELDADPDDSRIQELTEDLRAFSEFVADPKVRRSLDAAESFFQAMRLRRPRAAEEAPEQSDPHRAQ